MAALEHTRAVRGCYDRIAAEFAATRFAPWPEVETFLRGFDRRSTGLDVGCGNGRHVEPLLEHADVVVGVDLSSELLKIGKEAVPSHRATWLNADATALPITDDRVDIALCIATLHHLATHAARLDALAELSRVLRPTGRALISVWSVTHDRFDPEDVGDTSIPWTLDSGEVVDRFYHLFDQHRFDRMLEASDLGVVTSFASSGNHFAIVGPGDLNRPYRGRGQHQRP